MLDLDYKIQHQSLKPLISSYVSMNKYFLYHWTLEPLKVLEKRLRMPAAKIYKMIEKGTKDEWLKALVI